MKSGFKMLPPSTSWTNEEIQVILEGKIWWALKNVQLADLSFNIQRRHKSVMGDVPLPVGMLGREEDHPITGFY